MKYWKNMTTGGVVKATEMPAGKWWREVTEAEFIRYRAYVTRLMDNLEKAVAHKVRVFGD